MDPAALLYAPEHLGRDEQTGHVVESATNGPVSEQHRESVESDRITDLDRRLGPRRRADVDQSSFSEGVCWLSAALKAWIALRPITRSIFPPDPWTQTLWPISVATVDAADGAEEEKAVLIDVAGQHEAHRSVRIDDSRNVAHQVGRQPMAAGLHVASVEPGYLLLEAARRWRLDDRSQELEGLLAHGGASARSTSVRRWTHAAL
jgi:hypothetical protein